MKNVQNFKVANMNCKHCVNTIDKALRAIKEIDDVSFNLEEKIVTVYGNVSQEVIISTITDAGYDVVK